MRCMQALVRVQARVRARRLKLVHEKLQSKLEEEDEAEAQRKKTQLKKKLETDRRNQSSRNRESPSRKFHESEMKRDRAVAYALACQVFI